MASSCSSPLGDARKSWMNRWLSSPNAFSLRLYVGPPAAAARLRRPPRPPPSCSRLLSARSTTAAVSIPGGYREQQHFVSFPGFLNHGGELWSRIISNPKFSGCLQEVNLRPGHCFSKFHAQHFVELQRKWFHNLVGNSRNTRNVTGLIILDAFVVKPALQDKNCGDT